MRKNATAYSTARPAPRRIKRVTLSLLSICASTLIALGICEVVLRLFPSLLPEDAQLQLLWKNDDLQSETIADSYLGFRYPAHRTLVHRTLDFATTIETDEHGFRNKSPWPTRAQVVIVGDSLAFGYGVNEDKKWTSLLEEQLHPNRIVNISLPGFAPQQYFRYFKALGTALQPQLLILCIFPGNDVRDAKRFAAWEASGAAGSFAAWQFMEERDPDAKSLTISLSVLEQMRLLLALRAVRDNFRSRFRSETLEFPQGRIQLTPDLYQQRISDFDASDPGVRALTDSVRNIQALAEKTGTRVVVVLFPTKEEIYIPPTDPKFPDMVTPVKRALGPLQVDILDLSDGLRQHAADPQPMFFPIDGHPNELGNALIAHLIGEWLQKDPEQFGIAHAK